MLVSVCNDGLIAILFKKWFITDSWHWNIALSNYESLESKKGVFTMLIAAVWTQPLTGELNLSEKANFSEQSWLQSNIFLLWKMLMKMFLSKTKKKVGCQKLLHFHFLDENPDIVDKKIKFFGHENFSLFKKPFSVKLKFWQKISEQLYEGVLLF